MTNITIELGEKEIKILKKRAEKNFLDLKEQIEDIIRRSCINISKNIGYKQIKVEDRLVEIFSRDKRGRKNKKKK